jgi:hypothetical protein
MTEYIDRQYEFLRVTWFLSFQVSVLQLRCHFIVPSAIKLIRYILPLPSLQVPKQLINISYLRFPGFHRHCTDSDMPYQSQRLDFLAKK